VAHRVRKSIQQVAYAGEQFEMMVPANGTARQSVYIGREDLSNCVLPAEDHCDRAMARRKTRLSYKSTTRQDRPLSLSERAPDQPERLRQASSPADVGPLWPYQLAVLLMPLIVLWHRDNALYTAPSYADPWFYLGYFRNLVEFKRDLFYGFYYGSRLSWILPGLLVHSVFSPAVANSVLHLAVQSTATLSLFSILRIVSGVRSAFLATMVFSVQPWLWVATGWDYPDGAGIAYCLLTMALLTRSAVQPGRQWTLFAAGTSLAGMMYSHIFLGTLTPVLLLYYIGLVWAWRGTSVIDSVRTLCIWAGAGYGIVTAVFCGINYFLDGRFWFYAPSVARAVSMAKDFQFIRGIWVNHELAAWLWPGVAGSITAISLIVTFARRASWRGNAAALLFSAQLLVSVLYMVFLQIRGTTVLGHYPYASYLLPFVFLVMGIAFWPAAQRMRFRTYILICCFAALTFAALWYNPHGSPMPASSVAQRSTIALSAGALAMALLLRERTSGTLLAVVGFAAFTAVALAQTVNLGGLDLHGNREQYQRIMQASDRIDAARKRRTVRFWFDRKEPNLHEYTALNALYLEEFSQLGTDFPRGCDVPVDPGTLVVVLSQNANAAEEARSALADCWRPFGMRPVLEAVDVVNRRDRPYTMAMLAAEADLSANRQVGQLLKTIDLEQMKLGDVKASLERAPEGLAITTLPDFGAFAGRVRLGLDAGLQGRLAVYVRARVLLGKVGFGILDSESKAFLVERFLRPSARATEVILPLPSPAVTGDLVICNARDVISKAVIERIEVRKMP
jgi:hypothetical protein